MPIHLPIYINERLVKEYKIGRLIGDTNPESVNTYVIAAENQSWDEGIHFTHKYGDGLEVCIQKAMSALTVEELE